MRTLCPAKFEIGSAAAEPLSAESVEFYQWIASETCGEEFSLLEGAARNTFPITNEDVQNRASIVYSLVCDYFQALETKPELVIFDFTSRSQGVFRGALFLHLALAIKAILNLSWAASIKGIILVPELPPTEDSFMKELSGPLKDKRIVIIDNNGKYIPDASFPSGFSPQIYVRRLRQLGHKPDEMLDLRMIRRLGHFKRKSKGGVICKRYFYDASKCVDAIVDLMKATIAEECNMEDPPIFVYDSTLSPWLEESVSAVQEEMQIQFFPARRFIKSKHAHKGPVIIVSDLVDTGDTVREIYKGIRKAAPGSTQVRAISVLSTEFSDETRQLRTIKIGNDSLDVRCFLKVRQKSMPADRCPMCELGIPYSNYRDEDYDMIDTYYMWEMNDEAGYKAEEDVPGNREQLTLVPDYPKMINVYGSWIVSKMEKRLQSNGYDSPDVVVVCPKELAPMVFSDYLNLMLGATVIQIPRSVLNEITRAEYDVGGLIHTWETEAEKWLVQLRSLNTDEVIIMDEFLVSGGTFKALHALVAHVNRIPYCYFPLVNFNPALASDLSVPVLSLYEFRRVWN